MIFRCLTALAYVVCLLLPSSYAIPLSAQATGSMPIGERFQIQAPPSLPSTHVHAINPPTVESISSGLRLDDDKNISQERKYLVAFPETPVGEIPPGVGALV